MAISSSDLFHGKTIEELEAAEALTSFRVDLDSVEIPTPESYDTTTNLVENEQNITTDTSSQVTYRNIFLYIQVYLRIPPFDTWLCSNKIYFCRQILKWPRFYTLKKC